MANFTGFPSVPTKERTPSRLSVAWFGKNTGSNTIASFAAGTGDTVVTLDTGETLTAVDGDMVLIWGTKDATYDGVHVISAYTAGPPSTFNIDVTFGVDAGQGFVLNFTSGFNAMGQVQDVSGNQTFDTDDWSTIGTEQTTEPNDVTRPVTMNMYVDKDLSEAGGAIGGTTGEAIRLDPTGANNVHIVLFNYDGRTSTSTVQNYVVFVDVQWDDLGITQSTDDYNLWALSGNADDIFAKVPVIP